MGHTINAKRSRQAGTNVSVGPGNVGRVVNRKTAIVSARGSSTQKIAEF